MRAASAATAGNKCIRLRRDSDDTEQDFNTLANGDLDLASIATFGGAAGLFCVKLYDQIGTLDATETAFNDGTHFQYSFLTNIIGTHPALSPDHVAAKNPDLHTASTTIAQPFTLSCFAERTGATSSFTQLGVNNSNGLQAGFNQTTNTIYSYAGGAVVTASATDNAFHAIQFVFNGSSSDINVDGTVHTVSPGTGGISAEAFWIGNNSALSGPVHGYFTEVGIWPSAFSSTDSTNVSNNQKNYWSVSQNYSLSAAGGSYTFTGSALTPKVGMPASGGSYAFTGTAITPAVGLPLGGGSYAFTGAAVTPALGAPLAGGAYSVSGTAIVSKIGRLLAGGAYSFNGTASTPAVGASLAGGSYVFAGTAIGPAVGMPLAGGAYTFSGSSLTPGAGIPLDGGSYTFSGSAVTLSSTGAKTISPDSGAYTFTGSSVTPKVGFPLGGGAYSFTGTVATLALTRAGVVAGSGAYHFNGTAAALAITRTKRPRAKIALSFRPKTAIDSTIRPAPKLTARFS